MDAPTHRPQRAPDLSVTLGPFDGRCSLTMNRLPHRAVAARIKRRIRSDVIRSLRAQAVPLGAMFVRAALLYHPPTATRPDPNNLLPTLKPVVDALQPTITTARSSAPGYGLIADDDVTRAEQTEVYLLERVPGDGAWWRVDLDIWYPGTPTDPREGLFR